MLRRLSVFWVNVCIQKGKMHVKGCCYLQSGDFCASPAELLVSPASQAPPLCCSSVMRWSARTLTMSCRCLSMLEGTAWRNQRARRWVHAFGLLAESCIKMRERRQTWMLSGSGSDSMDCCASSSSKRALSHRSVRLSKLCEEAE